MSQEQLDAYWMPYTANRQFKQDPRIITKAQGAYFTDSQGRQIFDGLSGLWTCGAGHCRPEILAATFSIALVIFCMFFTEAIFERISFSPATLIVLSGQIVAAQFERISGPSSQIEGTLNTHRQ